MTSTWITPRTMIFPVVWASLAALSAFVLAQVNLGPCGDLLSFVGAFSLVGMFLVLELILVLRSALAAVGGRTATTLFHLGAAQVIASSFVCDLCWRGLLSKECLGIAALQLAVGAFLIFRSQGARKRALRAGAFPGAV